jgi:hypothetical protein
MTKKRKCAKPAKRKASTKRKPARKANGQFKKK